MDNDELSPIHKTPDLSDNVNTVRHQHGYPISTAVATEKNIPAPSMPERMALNPGHDEQESHHHASTPTRDFNKSSKKQSSAECPLEVCKIRNRSNTNFEGTRPAATGYSRTPSAPGTSNLPTSARSTARSTARNTSRSTTHKETTIPVVPDQTTTRDSFLRASTTRSQPTRRRETASTSQRTSGTPSVTQLDRSPGRNTATSPGTHERTSIGPRGQTLTTISKREDDDCTGGIVRWMEKCVHNRRPLPWGGSRWSSEPGCHDNAPGCGGYGTNNYQVPNATPRGQKCNGCDKKYCYYPGMKAQQQAAHHQNEAMQNMPFIYPPSCPEDPQSSSQPARCNPRYGQPIPLAAYQTNYNNRYTNPAEGINPPAKPCNPKNPSNMNTNLVSHISGFEPPPVTQPINSHYVGYSQKYPQDLIKSRNV